MDAEFIRELFASFRPVTVRRMFGGAGIYADDVMFALIAYEVIYLKAGESNEADFIAEDLPPFVYEANNGKRTTMSYRRMPDRLYDDPDELAQWAARALHVALNKAGPRQKKSETAGKPKRPVKVRSATKLKSTSKAKRLTKR